MEIAIDARAASHPQPGGFKSYTLGVLDGLARLAPEQAHHLTVFFDRPCALQETLPGNIRQRILPAGPPLWGAFYREQWRLPHALRQAHTQVAHFPCNVAPLACPVPFVVTLHDLAPLRFRPAHQTPHNLAIWLYWRALIPIAARRSRAIVTDSQAVKEELSLRLGIAPERIFVVPAAANAEIHRLPPEQAGHVLHQSYGLSTPYILAMASKEPRKNTVRVLEAYAALPQPLRRQFPLAVVVPHRDFLPRLQALGVELDIGDQVRWISRPDDLQLSALYSAAHLFVFSSLYEGFGLPVLEAMKCAAPVVTSDRSSLPEVAGEAAVLVDPTDTMAIAQGIQRVLEDDTLRGELVARGLRRAETFSWEATARGLIEVYEWAALSSY